MTYPSKEKQERIAIFFRHFAPLKILKTTANTAVADEDNGNVMFKTI